MIWYVHAQTGSDSNVGWQSSAPFATLTKLATVMVSGDTAYLAGTFREQVTCTGLDGCTWRQWAGNDQWIIRGDTVVSGWTSLGGGVYQKNIGAGLSVKSVVVDWDTSVNAFGLHYGHMVNGTFGSLSAGQWAYSTPNLQVRLADSSDPASKTVAWCRNGNGMALVSCTNCTVDDFTGYLWCDATANNGYALHVTGGVGITCRINVTRDCGYHHVGFPGGACTNNIVEPSTYGLGRMEGNASGGVCIAVYTSLDNAQTGNIVRGITMYATPFLKTDGTAVSTTQNFGGVIVHTDGVKSFPAGAVRVSNCEVVYPYATGGGIGGFSAANTATPTANNAAELVADNYGAIFTECVVRGPHSAGLVLDGSAALVRCSIRDVSQLKCQTGAIANAFNTTTATTLMDACEIMGDCDGASAGRLFNIWTNRRFVLLNCTAMDYGAGSNEHDIFKPTGNSATVRAHGCVFGFARSTGSNVFFYANGGYSNAANGAGLTPRVFEDCAYVRVSSTVYDTNASYNTSAEWTSGIDAGAQHTASNPCEEPAAGQPMSHARLSRTHALWAYRDTGTTAHTSLGINRVKWKGTLGCYQYNASATVTWPTMTSTPPAIMGKPMMLVGFPTGALTNDRQIEQTRYADPATELEASMVKAGAAGIEAVIFHIPHGHDGTDYYSVASIQDVPNQIREVLANNIERWKSEYGVERFGVYLGGAWRTSQDGGGGPVKPLPFPDWEDDSVAAVLESWRDAGCDFVGWDRTVNQGNDLYSSAVDDQWDSLGGFSATVCGMTPVGEAFPFDGAAFDATLSAASEYFILETYYQSLDGAGRAVLDGTLPAGRRGFHWSFDNSNFTREAAQARINQGYIVSGGDDMSAEDLAWLALPADGDSKTETTNTRVLGRGRVGRARGNVLAGA